MIVKIQQDDVNVAQQTTNRFSPSYWLRMLSGGASQVIPAAGNGHSRNGSTRPEKIEYHASYWLRLLSGEHSQANHGWGNHGHRSGANFVQAEPYTTEHWVRLLSGVHRLRG